MTDHELSRKIAGKEAVMNARHELAVKIAFQRERIVGSINASRVSKKMSQTTMVDRLARALWRQHVINDAGNIVIGEKYDPPPSHYDYHATAPLTGKGFVEGWEAMARAAIAAMREPTPEMALAGLYAPHDPYNPAKPEDIWEAMIDAALKKDSENE